jgi:hypothetical protein
MWFKRIAYGMLVRRSERKTPLGRPRSRWVDSIRMDLEYITGGYVD